MILCVFFFKQKTAYEMRISDWSSDVCSSDLAAELERIVGVQRERQQPDHQPLFGFGGMLGPGQRVGGVVVPVHVAELQPGLVDGGFGSLATRGSDCRRISSAPAFGGRVWAPPRVAGERARGFREARGPSR